MWEKHVRTNKIIGLMVGFVWLFAFQRDSANGTNWKWSVEGRRYQRDDRSLRQTTTVTYT